MRWSGVELGGETVVEAGRNDCGDDEVGKAGHGGRVVARFSSG